jgi:hypothetical protein
MAFARLAKRLCCCFLLAALAVLAAPAPALALDVVLFDRPVSQNDFRREYAQALLREILKRTESEFGPWKLELAPAHMERKRMFAALREGRLVNVTAYPVNAEWARSLKIVPVPIDMGVQSWRVALIDKRRQPEFRSLDTARLKQMRAGAGSAWVTVHSLQDNGFIVVTGGNYEGLFDMLMAERFDYFPRGVNEIFRELETHRRNYPRLALEESFLLHDQIPSMFFVSPETPRLYARVAAGMEAMVKDGALERFGFCPASGR